MSKPTYVNFRGIWELEGRNLRARAPVAEAVETLRQFWEDIINFHYDEGFPDSAKRAEMTLANFDEKVMECDWLLSTYEPSDVASLELAICREKFPRDTWEEFELNEHHIVVNASRTLVCDLFLCEKISASSNLALGGVPGAKETDESVQFVEARLAQSQAALAKMKELVAKHHGTQVH
jgi:hypothetical protein